VRRSVAIAVARIASIVIALVTSLLGATPVQATAPGTDSPSRGPQDTLHVTYHHYAVKQPGGRVRERVGIRLGASADVHIGIRDSDGRYIRGRVNLGALPAGWHSWTWSGYKNGGAAASDGHYNVTVHATFKESGFTTQDGTGAFVHRRYHPGSVSSTYSTIYPRATTLHDSTTLGLRPPEMVKATLRIRNAAGQVVFTRAYKVFHTYLRVPWDGRDHTGRALRAGTYYVTVSGVDKDGLAGRTRARAVKVSGQKLVQRTKTITVAPADAVQPFCGYDSGNGCWDYPQCGTVAPSDRFTQDGALSYRSGRDCTQPASWVPLYRRHDVRLTDNAPRGYGTMAVSMFGGPTTAGAADQGVLSAGSLSASTGPDAGDHTTSLPPVPVGGFWVGYGEYVPGLSWAFTTRDGASYDAAYYTVTYTFLTPQP
jgi:flagellar hook assembly protein FlgD